MNSRPVILVAFAIWCLVCARWYVCGIKNACGASQPVVDVIDKPANNPDSANLNSGMQPITSDNGTGASPANPVTPDKIDNVQMETVEDQMLIYFPYKSIRREDNEAIDNYLSGLARQLIASGENVRITGHTDFVGESKVNYNYGILRANSIRDILIKKGVPKTQIVCKSYGEKKPVATNDTPYGRYLNRRAEIRVGK